MSTVRGHAAGMMLQNESPTYLLSKGDRSGAEACAKALWGEGYKAELYASASEESGVLYTLVTQLMAMTAHWHLATLPSTVKPGLGCTHER